MRLHLCRCNGSRISAATGLPTIIGWERYQQQQRYPDTLPARVQDVRIIGFSTIMRNGTFGQLASNLFGIDQGAIIGFEYRYAVAPHVQVAAYRSIDSLITAMR